MNKTQWMTGLAVAAIAAPIFAQQVPALATGQSDVPPPVNLVSPDQVRLDGKEAHGVRLADQWKSHPDRPRRGADGRVKYLYGATMPTLVCSPLQVCNIELQPGETVIDINSGDTVRWKITPATMGNGANATTLLVVKPTDAGLVTNLSVTTNRRLYSIKLVSTQKNWIPVLSFDYPDDVERQWATYRSQQAKQVSNNVMPTTGQNLANLDFGYQIGGDSPNWKPVRVYTDGSKTFIQFPSSSFAGEAPALVAKGSNGGLFSKASTDLINYRPVGDRYVVDKVIDRASLIVGVGSSQTEVTITRTGGK